MLTAILLNSGAILVIMGLGVPFLDGSLFGYAKKVNDRVRETKRKLRAGLPTTLEEENEKKAVDCGNALRRWGIKASILGIFLIFISAIFMVISVMLNKKIF